MNTPISSVLKFWGVPKRIAEKTVSKIRYQPLKPEPDKRKKSLVFLPLRLSKAILPPWLPMDKPTLVPLPVLRDVSSGTTGQTLAHFEGENGKIPFIRLEDEQLVFYLSPDDIINTILTERYRRFVCRLCFLLPPRYHAIPPIVRLLLFKFLVKTKRFLTPSLPFPSWPYDKSVEVIRAVVLNSIRLILKEDIPVPDFWPDRKKWAVALTHDVDTSSGLAKAVAFITIEKKFGLKACYNIVGRGYRLDEGRLLDIHQAGMEIGLHGVRHDNRIAYLPQEKIEELLNSCSGLIKKWNIGGFRSPSLLRSEALHRALSSHFLYDSSVPDTETLTSYPNYAGCCSIFPFWRNGILELPLTVPMDSSLIFLGYKSDQIYDIWLKKLEWIKRVGGLAVITTHTDPHFSGNDTMLKLYERLLEYLSNDSTVWITRPREIAAWWKEREGTISPTPKN